MNKSIFSAIFLIVVTVLCGTSEMQAQNVPDEYIYFDLAADNVTIGSTYTGYVYVNGTKTKVTGIHSNTNKYYIYQSSTTTGSPGINTLTGYASQDDFDNKRNIRIPSYSFMMAEGKAWKEYITDNTDTEGVAAQWTTSAGNALRTGTANTIKISGTNTYDITIDNLWCTYNGENSSSNSGIYIQSSNHATGTVTLRMKNDSRFTNIYYHRNSGKAGSLSFTSADGDNSTNGTLTVIQTSADWKENDREYAVIGGYYDNGEIGESRADSYGMYVKGGTMYVGKSPIMKSDWTDAVSNDQDGCFSGGATGDGEITIDGGIVTAVNHTTSAAIGGGAALKMPAGNGYVTINGGKVYAYSFGIYAQNRDGAIACTAIGSGSTGGRTDHPNEGAGDGTVTITGGEVYAKSIGGTAIGGGNSTLARGGDGTITITGGTVTAISAGGTIAAGTTHATTVTASNSIGGGTGGRTASTLATGGDATITISGSPIIRAGSVGGGKTNNNKAKIGAAQVDITGNPDISAQFLLVKGAAITPYFNMSGGTIHDSKTNDEDYQKVEKTMGGAVYLEDGNCTITGGQIYGCEATDKGGAIFVKGGNVTLSGGTVGILGKPNKAAMGGGVFVDGTGNVTINSGSIGYNQASDNGGGFYVSSGSATISGGSIQDNIATSGNGGGFFANGGDVTINDGLVSGNSSVSGGGIYVNGGNFSFTNGTISDNTATSNGGGAYVSSGTVTFHGNVVSNTASNGGGLYLGPGASMEFKGGLIINNNAVSNSTSIANTAYHGGSNIEGCGGGIYLQNGTDGSHKATLTFRLDPNDKTFGLYTNRANMAGDDIVSEGQYTEVVLPSVREMQLYGFDGKDATPFWYQDYFTDDTGYSNTDGHAVEGDVTHIDRYREIIDKYTSEYTEHRIPDERLPYVKNNYLCLTLSYNMLDITLTANHLQGRETALFQLIRHGNVEDKKYDVLLKKDGNGVASRTLRNMPWGTYSVIPNDSWNWLYEKIPVQMNLRLGETGNYEFVFDMKHHNTASLPEHDERQPGIGE